MLICTIIITFCATSSLSPTVRVKCFEGAFILSAAVHSDFCSKLVPIARTAPVASVAQLAPVASVAPVLLVKKIHQVERIASVTQEREELQ